MVEYMGRAVYIHYFIFIANYNGQYYSNAIIVHNLHIYVCFIVLINRLILGNSTTLYTNKDSQNVLLQYSTYMFAPIYTCENVS